MTSTFTQRGGSDATSTRPETLTNAKPEFDVVALFKENPSRNGDLKGNASVDNTLDFGSTIKLYGGDHPPLQVSELPKITGIIKDNPSVPVQLVDAASEIHHAQDALASGNPDRAAQWLQEALRHLKGMNNGEKQSDPGAVDRTPSHGEKPHKPDGASGDKQPDSASTSSGGDKNSCGDNKSDSPSSAASSDKKDPYQELKDTLADAVRALARGNMREVQALLSSLVSQVDALTGNGDNGNPDTGIKPPMLGTGNRPFWGIYGSPENPAIPSTTLPEDLPGIGLNNPDIAGTGGLNRPGFGGSDGPGISLPKFPGRPDFGGISDIPLPKLPELPNIPGLIDITHLPLPKLPAIGESPAFGLPEMSENGIGNLPTLPDIQIPGLSGIDLPVLKLPGVGDGNTSKSPLPKLPGFPSPSDLFDFL